MYINQESEEVLKYFDILCIQKKYNYKEKVAFFIFENISKSNNNFNHLQGDKK